MKKNWKVGDLVRWDLNDPRKESRFDLLKIYFNKLKTHLRALIISKKRSEKELAEQFFEHLNDLSIKHEKKSFSSKLSILLRKSS